MIRYARHLPALSLLAAALGLHFLALRWVLAGPKVRTSPWRKRLATLTVAALAALLLFGFSLGFMRVLAALPSGGWIAMVRGAALGWALACIGPFLAVWLWYRVPAHDAQRRQFLRAAGGATLAAPFAVGGFGVFVARESLDVRQVDIRVNGLAKDLDGLRLAQLTDIHLGPFLSVTELTRVVDAANEWRAHLALVTGDLISDASDPLDACLRELARLRASDGIYGCCGNHEQYARAEGYCVSRGSRLGIEFLRAQSRKLRFGGSVLNLAGVDHQRMGGPYLTGAERLTQPGNFNLLLSHNPDVFPAAARQEYQLVISGHTHGGQLALEMPGVSLSVSRLFTPFVHGLYRERGSALYVSRGIGTVGVPVRLGAPPELTLIRLRAAS